MFAGLAAWGSEGSGGPNSSSRTDYRDRLISIASCFHNLEKDMTFSGVEMSLRKATPDQINMIEDEITRLETIVASQSVNGLFQRRCVKEAKLSSEQCYGYIAAARKHLVSEPVTYQAFGLAKEELNKCWEVIDEAIEKGGWGYKILCIYSADIVLFLLAVVVAGALLPFFYSSHIVFHLFPLWVPAAGAMGSCLRFLWDLKYRTDDRMYCKNWRSGALITPLIGAIIAMGVYPAYFIASRLTVVDLDMPGFSISLLSGFGWKESVDLLSRLTKATLGSILSEV